MRNSQIINKMGLQASLDTGACYRVKKCVDSTYIDPKKRQ